jgi:hypothetical protein
MVQDGEVIGKNTVMRGVLYASDVMTPLRLSSLCVGMVSL